MTAKRARIAALLLCVLAPSVAAATGPPYAELQKAWVACIAVAAHSSRGGLGTHASEWPQGFRGCAIVARDVESREAEEAKRAWARWVANHAADQALIRKVSGMTKIESDVKTAAQKAEAARHAYTTALQENAPYRKLVKLGRIEMRAYGALAAYSARALGSGAAVQEPPLPHLINWHQFGRQCAAAAKRAAINSVKVKVP